MTHVKGHHRKVKGRNVWVKPHERKGGSMRSVPKRKLNEFEIAQLGNEQIDRNYRTHIETNWDSIEEQLKIIPKLDEDEDRPNAYFTIDKKTKHVELFDISHPSMVSSWPDPEENWIGILMVDGDTTKQELLDQNLSNWIDFD